MNASFSIGSRRVLSACSPLGGSMAALFATFKRTDDSSVHGKPSGRYLSTRFSKNATGIATNDRSPIIKVIYRANPVVGYA